MIWPWRERVFRYVIFGTKDGPLVLAYYLSDSFLESLCIIDSDQASGFILIEMTPCFIKRYSFDGKIVIMDSFCFLTDPRLLFLF